MGINASIKQNEIYINNNLSFTINNSHVWFGKERCELLDVFGNVLLNFVVKHRFLRTTKFDVKQNNINNKYELVYSNNDLFWNFQGIKYHIRRKCFSVRVDFFKNGEKIGTTDKKSIRVSYLDIIQFTFTTDNIEEVELCLLLFVIHSVLFNNDD